LRTGSGTSRQRVPPKGGPLAPPVPLGGGGPKKERNSLVKKAGKDITKKTQQGWIGDQPTASLSKQQKIKRPDYPRLKAYAAKKLDSLVSGEKK